jgi:hypothetical protein
MSKSNQTVSSPSYRRASVNIIEYLIGCGILAAMALSIILVCIGESLLGSLCIVGAIVTYFAVLAAARHER